MTDKDRAQRQSIDLIMVEDSDVDAELVADALVESGLSVAVRRVKDGLSFHAALDERLPDAILSDWTFPNFSGRKALAVAHERCPGIPVIFVSGTISESKAFKAMRQGASDYVFKHQLNYLGPALTRALKEAGAICALRESEERFRQATESMRDAFVVFEGESGTITLWNTAAETVFGYCKDEIIGHVLHDIITPLRFREAARAGLAQFINTGKCTSIDATLELTALHKNGTEFPIELSVSAMRIQNKWYATGIARDESGHGN
jgi:PAS domain S-box-containing protein